MLFVWQYPLVVQQLSHYQSVPKTLLSASLTDTMLDQLQHNLKLPDARIFAPPADRPGLYCEVREKSMYPSYKSDIIKLIQQPHLRDKAGIIYSQSRRDCEEFTKLLLDNGQQAASYHAGMGDQRDSAFSDWICGRVRILVATVSAQSVRASLLYMNCFSRKH